MPPNCPPGYGQALEQPCRVMCSVTGQRLSQCPIWPGESSKPELYLPFRVPGETCAPTVLWLSDPLGVREHVWCQAWRPVRLWNLLKPDKEAGQYHHAGPVTPLRRGTCSAPQEARGDFCPARGEGSQTQVQAVWDPCAGSRPL